MDKGGKKMIEKYIKLGVVNKLLVTKIVDFGVYLGSEEKDDTVLLPKKYVSRNVKIGDIFEVFVYSDSEDRYIATTKRPYAKLNEFGIFEVVDTTKFGAFVDWGLEKHLFLPFSAQSKNIKKGDKVIGTVKYDEKTDRLYLDAKIGRNLEKAKNFRRNDEVEILVIAKTPMGFKVIANNAYEGMLFDNEIFEKIKIGERKRAFVKNVREDGKLDLSLIPLGKTKEQAYNKVWDILRDKKEINLNTKSNPEDIKNIFNISKKAFKAAVNQLNKENKIEMTENGIKLKN